MKLHMIIFLLQCSVFLVTTEDVPETRDLADNTDDYDDLGRKHRKKKKHQSNPCNGGYGRTFGSHEQTYVSAPVTNYFFGCGGQIAPAPIQYPVQFGGHGHGGHGHGSHGHGSHGHGSHGHGSHGHGGNGYGGHGPGGHGHGGFNGPVNYGYNQGYNQPYQFGHYQPFHGPQNVVAAAASGFGNVVAGYFNRPRKVNKQINQFLRPLYNLF